MGRQLSGEVRILVALGLVSYLRLTDSCITQLKAQGPSRTCNEDKEEEAWRPWCWRAVRALRLVPSLHVAPYPRSCVSS